MKVLSKPQAVEESVGVVYGYDCGELVANHNYPDKACEEVQVFCYDSPGDNCWVAVWQGWNCSECFDQ